MSALVGEREFYSVSLFDEPPVIGDLSKLLCDAIAYTAKNQHLSVVETSSVRSMQSVAPCINGDLASLPLTRCDHCGANNKTCFQRPVEFGYYCAECVEKEEVLVTEFNSATGHNQLKHLRCFLCDVSCSNMESFDGHCQSREHKQKRDQSREAAASSHIATKIEKGQLLSFNSLRCALMTTLRQADCRFRQHMRKEDIEQLPLFRMNREWVACERSIMSRFSLGALQSRPCLDLADDATPLSPEEFAHEIIGRDSTAVQNDKCYRVIHVSPTMSCSDFQLMRKILREETTFGFDTENAPGNFFPRSMSINPGPHLIQIATKEYVFLISTTPLSYWQENEPTKRLSTRPSAQGATADISEADIEAATAMMYGLTGSSNEIHHGDLTPKSLLTQRAAIRGKCVPLDAVDAFSAFDGYKGNNLPMSASSSSIHRPTGNTQGSSVKVPVTQRLPKFLLDFFCRQDTVLVGFGLSQDVRQIRQLMKQRLKNLLESAKVDSGIARGKADGSHAELFEHYLSIFSKDMDASLDLLVSLVEPPTLDLSLLFLTDGMAPSVQVDNAATAVETCDVAHRCAQVHATRPNQIVGTTQAVARVFGRKFSKPKSLVISDWCRPSYLLPSRQIVYAARDVVVPLLFVKKLLEVGASRMTSESNCRAAAATTKTSSE